MQHLSGLFPYQGVGKQIREKGSITFYLCDNICIEPLEYALVSMHQVHGLQQRLCSLFHMGKSGSVLKIAVEFLL